MSELATTTAARCGVYRIANTVSGKFYIGSSRNTPKRIREHRFHLRRGTHDNDYLQKAWNKHSEAAFSFAVIEVCGEGDLLEREEYWIAALGACDKGYNIQPTPTRGNKGVTRTEEQRQRMRLAKAHISEETREKLRRAMLGKKRPGAKGHPITDQQRAKLRAFHIGLKATSATRAKMSASQRACADANQATHCERGHALEGANLSLERQPNGRIRRRCRICKRAMSNLSYARKTRSAA